MAISNSTGDDGRSDVNESVDARTSLIARLIASRRVTGLALAIVAANLLFLGHRFFSSPPAPPGYGETLPWWQAVDLDGAPIDSEAVLAGHFGLLFYADRAPSAPFVRYLQVLENRYREFGKGLRAVLVVGPEHSDLSEAKAAARGASYLVVHDTSNKVRRSLRLSAHQDHSFLVEEDGRLAFSAGRLLRRDELRQHVEKHLLGEIQYSTSPVSLLGPDARLPAYEVVDAGSSEDERLIYAPSAGTTVAVLPAALCAACSPVKLHDRLAALYRLRCEGAGEECPLDLLVTAGYPMDGLLSALRSMGVHEPRAFQAIDTLTGLEDEYFTKRRSRKAGALVLEMGPSRQVSAVSTLDELTEVTNVR